MFEPTDDDPVWMDVDTREKQEMIRLLAEHTKKESTQKMSFKKFCWKKDLQAAAQLNGILIEEVKEKIIEG